MVVAEAAVTEGDLADPGRIYGARSFIWFNLFCQYCVGVKPENATP